MKIKNNLLEPYLLGCLLGDGGLVGNLTFASLDQDIIDKVNESLAQYNYQLVKRSKDPKRSSEYSIRPKTRNTIKYLFIYKENTYSSMELLKVLQAEGYKITNNDTLLSIVGKSSKTKKCNTLKYYPELKEIICKQVKKDQRSAFINLLNKLNLRVKFDKKHIPEEYFNLSYSDRLLLFNGLMDTDGSVGTNKRLEFCVASETLANDFARLAESLGYTYKIYLKQSKYFNKKYNELRYGHIAYRVMLSYNKDIQPFLCKRKLDLYKVRTN